MRTKVEVLTEMPLLKIEVFVKAHSLECICLTLSLERGFNSYSVCS